MKRVLIVDDFDISRTLVKTVVEHPDRQILEAPDGVEALKVLAEHDVDLVLTDGQMPRMDGFELMQTAGERFPSVPFIVVSGSPVTPELRALGPLRIFSKPFVEASLKETVDNVLETKRSLPLRRRRVTRRRTSSRRASPRSGFWLGPSGSSGRQGRRSSRPAPS